MPSRIHARAVPSASPVRASPPGRAASTAIAARRESRPLPRPVRPPLSERSDPDRPAAPPGDGRADTRRPGGTRTRRGASWHPGWAAGAAGPFGGHRPRWGRPDGGDPGRSSRFPPGLGRGASHASLGATARATTARRRGEIGAPGPDRRTRRRSRPPRACAGPSPGGRSQVRPRRTTKRSRVPAMSGRIRSRWRHCRSWPPDGSAPRPAPFRSCPWGRRRSQRVFR